MAKIQPAKLFEKYVQNCEYFSWSEVTLQNVQKLGYSHAEHALLKAWLSNYSERLNIAKVLDENKDIIRENNAKFTESKQKIQA